VTRLDDDNFIRQLLDSPRDGGPRLVYADWLEDHADPRAAYLRAEAAWAAKRKNRKRLETAARKLAAGLDPVWAARVSRPPLGVCCDDVRFSNCGPERSPADLDKVERRLKAKLPPDYRAFLLNYNGGNADPSHVPDPRSRQGGLRCLCLASFYRSSGAKGDYDPEREMRFMRSIYEDYADYAPVEGGYLAEEMLPVVWTQYDLGSILVGIAPDNFGRVFHFREWARSMREPSAIAELAPSFAHLLSMLGPDLED
jgi:uncharacterized protein (TIGR02996 family)